MLERLRGDYPRMAAIIVADSLYSKQPFIERLRAARFSFLLVAQRGDHKSLFADVEGLRRGNLLNRHHTVHRGERREYEWVTGVPLNGKPDAPLKLHPVPDRRRQWQGERNFFAILLPLSASEIACRVRRSHPPLRRRPR